MDTSPSPGLSSGERGTCCRGASRLSQLELHARPIHVKVARSQPYLPGPRPWGKQDCAHWGPKPLRARAGCERVYSPNTTYVKTMDDYMVHTPSPLTVWLLRIPVSAVPPAAMPYPRSAQRMNAFPAHTCLLTAAKHAHRPAWVSEVARATARKGSPTTWHPMPLVVFPSASRAVPIRLWGPKGWLADRSRSASTWTNSYLCIRARFDCRISRCGRKEIGPAHVARRESRHGQPSRNDLFLRPRAWHAPRVRFLDGNAPCLVLPGIDATHPAGSVAYYTTNYICTMERRVRMSAPTYPSMYVLMLLTRRFHVPCVRLIATGCQ